MYACIHVYNAPRLGVSDTQFRVLRSSGKHGSEPTDCCCVICCARNRFSPHSIPHNLPAYYPGTCVLCNYYYYCLASFCFGHERAKLEPVVWPTTYLSQELSSTTSITVRRRQSRFVPCPETRRDKTKEDLTTPS